METQYWLAELDKHDTPTLMDGPHDDREGPEKALGIMKRLPMIVTDGRKFAIAKVDLSEPTGQHGELNEDTINMLVKGGE